jgi:pimeloyl-ACP methyl ester carboxylesterase
MILGTSTPANPVHVFALDYRGYGLSTGSPTEEGLITDALTLLNFLTSPPLNIPPSRITLVGQSLGTAVAAAVAERYAFGAQGLAAVEPAISNPEPFAGVVLLAPFSNLPTLLESYSFLGLSPPLLSPLIGYPRAQKYVVDHIVDVWDTATRVARLTGVGPTSTNQSDAAYAHKHFDLTIIHARDDAEIPWREGFRVWKAATGENPTGGNSTGNVIYQRVSQNGYSEVKFWQKELGTTQEGNGKQAVKKVRWERVGYGGVFPLPYILIFLITRMLADVYFSLDSGHNRVSTYSAAALAVLKSFEE